MGRVDEVGSGIYNVKKYLPHYAKNATYEFIDDDFFITRIVFRNDNQQDTKTGSEKPSEKNVEKTVEKIINAIKEKPYITIKELQSVTGLSRRGVEWQITKLKKQGRLQRIGPDKGGYWQVTDKME